jgi:hypothetical protein
VNIVKSNKLREATLATLLGILLPVSSAWAADSSARTAPAGPVLVLDQRHGDTPGNSMADFMYFVALISREPVSMLASPNNTQRMRLVSATQRKTGNAFIVTCQFEFTGEGFQKSLFDHRDKIHQNEGKLREGAVLDHLLTAISVEGPGALTVEVIGTDIGNSPQVDEVRLHFKRPGGQSPVTIDLQDIRYVAGDLRVQNEIQARVNTLTFRKRAGPPKMDITVATVHPKEAGDSGWEKLKGKVKATAVNWVMDPVEVEPVGNDAMLRFGLALASDAHDFTFPHARNLK